MPLASVPGPNHTRRISWFRFLPWQRGVRAADARGSRIHQGGHRRKRARLQRADDCRRLPPQHVMARWRRRGPRRRGHPSQIDGPWQGVYGWARSVHSLDARGEHTRTHSQSSLPAHISHGPNQREGACGVGLRTRADPLTDLKPPDAQQSLRHASLSGVVGCLRCDEGLAALDEIRAPEPPRQSSAGYYGT